MTEISIRSQEARWLGEMRGTHVGTGFLTIFKVDGGLAADLRTNFGGKVNLFDGRVVQGDHTVIELTSRPIDNEKSELSVTGTLTFEHFTESFFSSGWELSDGAKGVANWVVVSTGKEAQAHQSDQTDAAPVQIVSKTEGIGAVTIYRPELMGLIEKLRLLFKGAAEPIVTIQADGRELSQFANSLLDRSDLPSATNHCTINIVSQSQSGRRSIVIDLRKNEKNSLTVQSNDETWSTGTSVDVATFLNRYTSWGTGFFREYGLNVNAFILLFAIIMSPDLPLFQRVIFIICVVLFMIIFKWAHGLVPNAILYLDDTRRNPLRRQLPSIFSAVLAGILVGVLASVFQLLSKLDVKSLMDAILGP